MKYLLVILLILGGTDPARTSRINSIKAEAQKAYTQGDFKKAAADYQYLIDSMGVKEEEVKLNLANALFQLHDSSAVVHYNELATSPQASIRSRSNLQLGVIEDRNKHLEQALARFKESLKADPQNEKARYNYEMVKKKLDAQKNQQNQQNQQNKNDQNKQSQSQNQQQQQKNSKENDKQQQQNQQQQKDQDQKDKQSQSQQQKDQQQQMQQSQQDQQKKNADQQKEEEQRNLAEKLKEMNMSEEKAKMILEAMKNQEIQYLQQNTRKSKVPHDSSKPDW